MSTPWELYQQDLKREGFTYDSAQENAVKHLQRLYDELVLQEQVRKQKKWHKQMLGLFTKNDKTPIKGVYFWGGVGRGKTYLVDTFYDALPFENKMRTHFHRFMQRVHQDLTDLSGAKNPLDTVADKIAQEAIVICFDEFFVTDIGDAMILGGLMQKLFARGVSLVSTSNIVPDELYKSGLQRQRFIPAIELLNQHTEVVNVDSGIDYRLRTLEQAKLYHTPLGEQAEQSLKDSFYKLTNEHTKVQIQSELQILGRQIPTKAMADNVLWCDFSHLCEGARSQNDYIEIGKLFHTILISNIPIMGNQNDDAARRFINLIDEMYDQNVNMIMSGAAPITELYTHGIVEFEFQRTVSRMLEMQSNEYLAREHKLG